MSPGNLEDKQLLKQIAKQKALLGVVTKIRESLDLKQILEATVQEVCQLLEADRVGIYQFLGDRQWEEGVYVVETLVSPYPSLKGLEIRDECFAAKYKEAYREGKYWVVNDISQLSVEPCHQELLKKLKFKANIVVPLLKDSELWGLLSIHQCAAPRLWQADEIEFARRVALHLGVALQQSQLLQDAHQRSQDLQNLLAEVEAQKEEQRKLADREKAVFQVIDKIRRTLDVETIFQTTVTEVRQLLEADRVAVFRFEPGWNRGEIVSEDVLPAFNSSLTAKIKDDCFAYKHALPYQQGKIFAVADIYQSDLDSCYILLLERFQVRANLVVPLLQGLHLWGLLCIHQCSSPRIWQDSEKEFIGKIAANLGIALQQAELLSKTQGRSRELQIALAQVQVQSEHLAIVAAQERALARVIEQIRQSLDPERIFRATTHEVRQILKCDRVIVYRFDENWDGEFLYESLGFGWVPLTKTPGVQPVWDDTYLRETSGGRYRNHENFSVNDIYNAGLSQCHIDLLVQFQIRAFAVVPVFVADKLWGLLGVYQNSAPRIWDYREISLLAHIGNQLGVAVYQAQLLTKTQEQSQILQTTLADLTAIVDNLADGLLVTDIFGRITRYNPALVNLFNLEGVELMGRLVIDVFPATLAKVISQSDRASQDVVVTEIALGAGRQGQAQTTSIIKEESLSHEGGQCLGSVILIRDVTAEREIDRMKTEFLANVSHELRTPLTSVLGFASLIQEKLETYIFPHLPADDPKIQKMVGKVTNNIDIIVSEAERLTALINDVLDIAKMESGIIEWQVQPASPIEIVERAIATVIPMLENKNLTLVRQFVPDPPLILVDQDRIMQVVINLLSNAIKFTETGVITCRITNQDDHLEISISDTGMGLAYENRELIFDRFNQGGNAFTNKPDGTGLGLPICKQIVEHHGGKIWVESHLSQGSTFYFTIPTYVD
jgi:GAF domain-containing protein